MDNEFKLKPNQEVERIRVKPADNGGCILSYTLYTPTKTNSESEYKEVEEVYTDSQFETDVIPKITQLYKAEYYSKKGKSVTKGGDEVPMKAY